MCETHFLFDEFSCNFISFDNLIIIKSYNSLKKKIIKLYIIQNLLINILKYKENMIEELINTITLFDLSFLSFKNYLKVKRKKRVFKRKKIKVD
jgi:predicted metallopeptidase